MPDGLSSPTQTSATQQGERRAGWLEHLLREPLLHFVAAGLALFVIYRVLNPAAADAGNVRRIEINEADLQQLTQAWQAQGRASPTPAQLRNLVDQKVREEVLAREALALGLDKNDPVIKRRLAQRMEHLAEEMGGPPEPTREALQRWLDQHATRFGAGPLESIEADVKADWIATQRADARRKAFEAMRQRYDIVLPSSLERTR